MNEVDEQVFMQVYTAAVTGLLGRGASDPGWVANEAHRVATASVERIRGGKDLMTETQRQQMQHAVEQEQVRAAEGRANGSFQRPAGT